MGWRYQYILIGGLALLAASARIFLMNMEESPKWLVTAGKFEQAVQVLNEIARTNKSSISITASNFYSVAQEGQPGEAPKQSLRSIFTQISGLFGSRKLALSTSGVMGLWVCIGIA